MICIIGGGASGMMAGIAAAQAGGKVMILERNARLGKKLLATGNGRCNFTNTDIRKENYHGHDPAFAMGAIRRFSAKNTMDFFTRLGVVPKVEDRGRVFPASDQAGSILDLLRWELEALGVTVRTKAHVVDLEAAEDRFLLTLADGERIEAKKLILATGGKAHPQSGSDGAGFTFAKKLGHRIIPPRPALVQLKLGGTFPKLPGIKVQGEIQLALDQTQIAASAGELLFTNYGLSGLPALALSREAGDFLACGREPTLILKLAPHRSVQELEETISSRALFQPRRPLGRLFVGWFPNKLGEALIRGAKIPVSNPAHTLTAKQRRRLANLLVAWCFPITGILGWERAQVTAGGVAVSEVEATTLESKLIKDLYFAGEILDLDGDSGGYNLQWAWSSGFVAGHRAAQ